MTGAKRMLYVALIVALVTPWCFAQTSNPPPRGESPRSAEEDVIAVVPLTHVRCHDLASGINSLDVPVDASCASDTSVILCGPARGVDKVRNQVIPSIDVPQATADTRASVFIPLGHRPSPGLMNLVRTVVSEKAARIAIDEINRLLVVRASNAEIETVRELVEQIDNAPTSLTAHLYFIRVKVGAPSDPEQARLPGALIPVANALRESGFGSMSLMAPVIVTVDEGQHFQQQSILNTQNDEGIGDKLVFVVEGIAHLDAEKDIVQLEVQALTDGEYLTPEYLAGKTEFEVKTTVAMKLDSYVILAAAPASTSDGDSIAVAVHVSRN